MTFGRGAISARAGGRPGTGLRRGKVGNPCRWRILGPLWLGLLLVAGALQAADAQTPREHQVEPPFAAEVARILADPRHGVVLRTCPAELQGRWKPRPLLPAAIDPRPDATFAFCRNNGGACLERCLAEREGEACFGLARALQAARPRPAPLAFQALFARACAAGYAAGCTNRAAGVRNGDYTGDPIRARQTRARQFCETRSFDGACAAEDAWGCAMAGQAHRLGEGTPKNPKRARKALLRACALAPDFEACAFARGHLSALEPPKAPPAP